MFNEAFRERLRRGKYTSWASDLSEAHLEYVLWMVGELGMRALPVILFLEDPGAVERGTLARATAAIESLREAVRFGGRLDVNKGSPWRVRIGHRGEPEDWPPTVKNALETAAPGASWLWVGRSADVWDVVGRDAKGQRIIATVTDAGTVRLEAYPGLR